MNPRREPGVAWRVIKDEAVMVLPSTGRVHTLNEVGTRFWELLDGSRSVAQIAEELGQEFDATAEQLAQDCAAFAADLRERKLLIE